MNQLAPSRGPSAIALVEHGNWGPPATSSSAVEATTAIEHGAVLFLRRLAFDVESAEAELFSPSIVTAKNVSFDSRTERVGGARATGKQAAKLLGLLRRFSEAAASLTDALFPAYAGRLERARASFRPAEIAGRATSWRHDDTRLHVDSFPATPSGGKRILRVFCNVNPAGQPRSWRVGEPFEDVAARFTPGLRMPLPLSAPLLRLVGLTKSRRSPYDALMLQLHDAMKRDTAYQAEARQTAIAFPAGSTWMAFTDEVSHAAMAGQYQLEQTFLLPADAMREPERSPLRILERLKGRRLA